MYRIKQISTGLFLKNTLILQHSNNNSITSIFATKTGKIWKTKGPAIKAYTTFLLDVKKYKLNPNDFILEEIELVVISTITHSDL